MIARLKQHLQKTPYFIFLLPIFLLLHIELEFRYLIEYRFVYPEILQLVIVSPILFFLFYYWMKDIHKAGLISFAWSVVYYYFCDLKDVLNTQSPESFFSSYMFLLPLVLISLILFTFYVVKSKKRYVEQFLYLNLLLMAFLVFNIIGLISSQKVSGDLGDPKKTLSTQYQPCDTCVHPDIYYIVFDAYSASKVLKTEFEFDNSRIDSFLFRKGFFLTANSQSNYNRTAYSIGSTLNMNYLQKYKSGQTFFLKEFLLAVTSVFYSELIPILKKEGYEVINHSIFDFNGVLSKPRMFDPWDIKIIYTRHSLFKKLDEDLGWAVRQYFGFKALSPGKRNYAEARNRCVYQTAHDLTATIKKQTQTPKFVYTHFLVPHPPYAMDSSGNTLSAETIGTVAATRGYSDQIIYSNSLIQKFVTEIFYYSKKPFIIILQSDHGFNFVQPHQKKFRLANHSAIYFSNQDYSQLTDSLRNINTFRVVLNTFFNQRYSMLKDSSIHF